MLDVEQQLTRYGAYMIDLSEREVGAAETVSPPRRRTTLVIAAAIVLLVALVTGSLALTGGDGGSKPSVSIPPASGTQPKTITYTAPASKGFTIAYPASWHRAKTALTPDVTDGRELVSIGTYPLRAGATDCTHGPSRALADLPATGALITIEERTDSLTYGPRPTFPPSEDTTSKFDQPSECVSGSSYEHWFLQFDDHQRTFQVLVAFGLDATPATKDQAWAALNSLSVQYAPTNVIPNHVSASLYAEQALGATVVVDHTAETPGYYMTAVRNGDQICVDVRATGQPTGPQFCDIPAAAPWNQTVLASVVELDGQHYLLGVAREDVTGLWVNNVAPDPPLQVGLARRLPFPTLQVFVQPISTDWASLYVQSREGGAQTITIGTPPALPTS